MDDRSRRETDVYPMYSDAARLGERGVNVVSRITQDFGWLFKRNHQEHDFGIDAQIDLVTDQGFVTAQMFAVQIKCGASFLKERNRWGFVYRGDLKHFNYLANYPLSVLLVLCDPDTEDCYWTLFEPTETQVLGSTWKITVPQDRVLRHDKELIIGLLPQNVDSVQELQGYWSLNSILAASSYLHAVISRQEVNQRDISSIRAFFDRIAVTRELAVACQGEVEITIYGYEEDERELFEIPEVREYIARLDAVLPELFFFVRSEPPAHTLKLFAMCQTEVSIIGRRAKHGGQHSIEYLTKPVAEFLARHFAGLNFVTDELQLPLDENKRISFGISRAFGIRKD